MSSCRGRISSLWVIPSDPGKFATTQPLRFAADLSVKFEPESTDIQAMSEGNWLDVSAGPVDFDALMAKFRSAETLPDLPAAAIQLCDAIDKGDSNSAELERIILADPAITAAVLKSANSAMYGGKTNQASTVKGACMLLGEKSVRGIAVSVWVQSLVHQSHSSPKFSPTRFSEHSMFVGFLSKFVLAAGMKTKGLKSNWTPDELFAAGVLHDIGIGLLASIDAKLYDKVVEAAASYGWSTHEAFAQLTGRSLDLLSVAAAQAWKLPDLFIDVLMGFGEPLQAAKEQDALCCVHYAEYLANKTGHSLCDWRVEVHIEPAVLDKVAIDQDLVPEVLQLVENHTKQFVKAA